MSSRIYPSHRLVTCLTMFTILSACASGQINLVEEGRLEIETEAPEEITISVKGVFEEEELVEIKGVVWWQPGSPDELYSAHIDLEIAGHDGLSTTEVGVPLRRIFLHRAIRQRARFSALVESFAVEGATVRVIFHQGVHDERAGTMKLPETP